MCSCDPSVPKPPTKCWRLHGLVTLTVEQSGLPFYHSAYRLPNIRLYETTGSQAYNMKHTQTTYTKLISPFFSPKSNYSRVDTYSHIAFIGPKFYSSDEQ